MRTWMLIALAACSASQGSDVFDPPHCGDGILQADEGEQCDDGNAVSGDGCSSICKIEQDGTGRSVIHVAWHVMTIAGDASCPSGSDSVVIIATPLDSSATPYMDSYRCSDGDDNTEPVVPGDYRVKVQIVDHQAVVATSLPQDVTVVDGDSVSIDTDILLDGGYFTVKWVLDMTGQPITCAVANASEVDLIANDGTADRSFSFPCDDASGITGPLAEGLYTVHLEAANVTTVLGQSAPASKAIATVPNPVTDLGTIAIPIGP